MESRSDPIVEELRRVLDAVHQWTRHADTKAATLLAGISLIVSAEVQGLLKWSEHHQPTTPHIVTLVLTNGLLVVAAYYAIACISPTLGFARRRFMRDPVSVDDPQISPLYFDHISSQPSSPAYLDRLENELATVEGHRAALAQQVYANSKVCSEKQLQIGWALSLFRLSFLAGILTLVAFLV